MINFYCWICKHPFQVEDDTNIDEIRCPHCGSDQILIEVPLPDAPVMNYFT